MATTQEANRLTLSYKREQAAINATMLRELIRIWPALNKANIDGSRASYIAAVKALVKDKRRAAALSASVYYEAFRSAEGIDSAFTPLILADQLDDVLETVLQVTGPIAFKRAVAQGKATNEAAKQALVLQAGAVTRLVLGGGRDTLGLNMERDKAVVGWQRVTDGKPCHFCAMLAGRGAVYRSRNAALFAGNSASKFHDHCGCSVEPMYSRDAPLRPEAVKYGKLFKESTAGLSGNDAINAFRTAISNQS